MRMEGAPSLILGAKAKIVQNGGIAPVENPEKSVFDSDVLQPQNANVFSESTAFLDIEKNSGTAHAVT